MELLVAILNKEELLEKVSSILVECGISGATIVDSEGLGHFLAYEVPIFAGLRQFMGEAKSASKTIFVVLEDETTFDKINALLKEENIDFSHSGTGVLVTLPVNRIVKSDIKTE